MILNKEQLNQSNQKYKFWDSSITGNQRYPQDMRLVNQSEQKLEKSNESDRLRHLQSNLTSQFDADQNVSDFGQNSERGNAESKIKSLQAQIQALRANIEDKRNLNYGLVKQLTKITNQLRAAEALNQQLNLECDRLYTNVKETHDKFSQVQNQKMEFMIQLSALNQQKQLAVNKSEIYEEQVQYLNKKLESFQEDNSFQKSISNDMKKEGLVLKQQLGKMMVMMQNYSQLQEQVNRSHEINAQIQQRVLKLQQELKQTRIKVQQSQANEQKYMQQQNKLFLKIQQYESQNKILHERIILIDTQLRAKNEQMLNSQSKQNDYQSRYVKVLNELTRRNEDLIFEIIASSQRNHKLIDQRDFYQRRVQAFENNRNQRLPFDQFVSILNAKDSQVLTLKKRLELKQDQIEQLKSRYEQQQLNLKQKIGQLTGLVEIREREIANREQITKNEIHIYKKQYELILKRNQQIKNQQVKMRLQIMQKDRIIMDFIQRQKIQEEAKNRLNIAQ